MVARLLNLTGLYLGEEHELFAGRPDNPEGFFEHKRFYALNDRILEVFKASWDMPQTFPQGWETDSRLDPIYQDARTLVAEFNAHGGEWGWKDPRSSLTLAFWKKVIPGLKVVVCLRNPVDVCASLTKRGYASIRFGLSLWDGYAKMLEREVTPDNSIFTHYASYFGDPESELARVDAFCCLSKSKEEVATACKTVDRKLRHSDSSLFELIAAKADLSLIKSYVEACLRSGPVFAEIYRCETETMRNVQDRLEAADRLVDAKDRELDSLMAELQRTINEGTERMVDTIARKDAYIREILDKATAMEGNLTKHLAEVGADLHTAHTQLGAAYAEIHAIRTSRTWRLALRLSGLFRSIVPGATRESPPSAQPAKRAAAPNPEAPVEASTPPKFQPYEDLAKFAHSLALEKQKVELTPQARLGNKLLPPGSPQERMISRAMRAKQIAREHGSKALLGRMAGRPVPALPVIPEIQSNPSELFETVRQDLVKAEETAIVASEYHRSVTTMMQKGLVRGPNFVPLDPDLQAPVDAAVKLIAFYLTQFHPIPENDLWWGKGFTEWTNVSKAVPVYSGQYQPHLPDELGFYDLRVREVQERQVELAKQYGLGGFAFYYYWFAGKRLLEKPLDAFVQNPNIDFPFCLIWANENWTRRWDGRQNDVLMAQDHSPQGDVRFIEDLRPYLEHPNYIKVDGRPIIIVYRPDQLPEPKQTAERWRDYCLRHNLGNPLIVGAQTFGFENPDTIGFDAAMQFPPHNEHSGTEFQLDYRGGRVHVLEENYSGCICSYPALVGHKHLQEIKPDYRLFETAFPMWDNTPRLPLTGVNYAFSSPELYKIWLQKLCVRAVESQPNKDQRLVFINAWNEWAEGAHLEPDRKFGYGYLKATREALDFAKKVEDGSATPAAIVLAPDTEMEEQLKNKPHSPILVYQIGKVGSRSIYEELLAMGLPEPVLHVHMLNNIDRISRNISKRYPHPEGTLFYLRRGQMVRDWMKRGDDDTTWNVITGVREPVGRNVSAFFEMLPGMIPNIDKRYHANDLQVEELHELFLHLYDQRSPAIWFDDQFKPIFDIDVYATPFPHSKGYDIYEAGHNRALLIRIEDLNRTVQPAMLEFLGMKDFSVQTRNRSEDKLYHDLAVRFKQLPLPLHYVDQMLSSKYSQHFYTDEEREQIRLKWTCRG
jgi:hypothetical protein